MLHHISSTLFAAAVLTTAAAASTTLHNPTTLQTVSDAAASCVSLGDIDGDGLPDLVLGLPLADTGPGATGAVQAVSGADGSLLWDVPGDFVGASSGAALARIADLDGDGFDDVLVGAPALGDSSEPGSVQLRSGADGSLILDIQGSQAGAAFGFAVAVVADRDADGLPDLVVGSPQHDVGSAQDAGLVLVLSSADGDELQAAEGAEAGDQLGICVVATLGGEYGGSHDPDIIIGATAGGDDDQGAVQSLSAADLSLNWEIVGDASGDRFGASLALLGDVDDDGVPDVAIGATPSDGNGAPAGEGSVAIHSGADGTRMALLSGSSGSGFGSSLAALGDITGDGLPELAVGAPAATLNGGASGTLAIFDGSDLSTLHVMAGSAGAHLGQQLASLPDLDGDGLFELAVAAPSENGTGALRVLSFSRFATAANGVPGSQGVPKLVGQGTLAATSPLGVDLHSARGQAAVELVWGHALVIDPIAQTWVPLPVDTISGLVTSSAGTLHLDTSWPEGIAEGTTVYFQYRVVDPAAAGGLALSNVVAGLTQ